MGAQSPHARDTSTKEGTERAGREWRDRAGIHRQSASAGRNAIEAGGCTPLGRPALSQEKGRPRRPTSLPAPACTSSCPTGVSPTAASPPHSPPLKITDTKNKRQTTQPTPSRPPMTPHHPYLEVLPEAGWPVAPDKRVLPKPPCGGRREAQRARQLGRRGGLQRRHRTCRRLGVAVGGGHRRRRARRFRRRRRCRRRCRRHRRRWRRLAVGGWRAAAAEAGGAIDDAVGAHHRAGSDGRPAEATSGGCEKEGGRGGGKRGRGGAGGGYRRAAPLTARHPQAPQLPGARRPTCAARGPRGRSRRGRAIARGEEGGWCPTRQRFNLLGTPLSTRASPVHMAWQVAGVCHAALTTGQRVCEVEYFARRTTHTLN